MNRRRGQTLFEMLWLFFGIGCGALGADFGGHFWGRVGSVLGFVVGAGVWFGGWGLLIWFANWLSWPDFPPCPCGASGADDYQYVKFDRDKGWTVDGSDIRGLVYHCLQCGRNYLAIGPIGTPSRLLEIVPDGSLRYYLRPYRKKAFRKWEPDDAPAPTTDFVWPPLPREDGDNK